MLSSSVRDSEINVGALASIPVGFAGFLFCFFFVLLFYRSLICVVTRRAYRSTKILGYNAICFLFLREGVGLNAYLKKKIGFFLDFHFSAATQKQFEDRIF